MSMFAGVKLSALGERSDYGKWLIHGPQGAGKSTLASTIAEIGKTLYIDLPGEYGTRSFEGAAHAENIDVVRPESVTAFDDIYWALAKEGHPYKAVILDSMTALQKMTMRFMMGHNETAVREIQKDASPADQRTWGQTLNVMTDTATFWYSLANGNRPSPMHVILVSQTKVTEDELGSTGTHVPDVQKGALPILMASCDYAVYCDLESDYNDEGEMITKHVVRFGSSSTYRIKARVPMNLRGKIPSVMGRERPLTLPKLSKLLKIGGIPATAGNTK